MVQHQRLRRSRASSARPHLHGRHDRASLTGARSSLLAALALALSACAQNAGPGEAQGGPDADAAPATAPPPAVVATNEPADAKAARQAPPGKPLGPIALRYDVADAVQVGVPVDVRVTVLVERGLTNIAVEAAASEGLALASPALARYAEAPEGEPIVWTVTVTPRAEGTHRLTVTAEGEADGVRQTASMAVPLRTQAPKADGARGAQGVQSEPEAPAEAPPRTDEQGEPISVLPAQESD